eukprot:365841-Chlamydomonas_euryale.AAC.4
MTRSGRRGRASAGPGHDEQVCLGGGTRGPPHCPARPQRTTAGAPSPANRERARAPCPAALMFVQGGGEGMGGRMSNRVLLRLCAPGYGCNWAPCKVWRAHMQNLGAASLLQARNTAATAATEAAVATLPREASRREAGWGGAEVGKGPGARSLVGNENLLVGGSEAMQRATARSAFAAQLLAVAAGGAGAAGATQAHNVASFSSTSPWMVA